MKLLLYIGAGCAVPFLSAFLLMRGSAPINNPLIVLALLLLFGAPPLGAFWMLYVSIRHERNPIPLILLALFVPCSFVWYYFERVRPGKLTRHLDPK